MLAFGGELLQPPRQWRLVPDHYKSGGRRAARIHGILHFTRVEAALRAELERLPDGDQAGG